MLLGDETKEVDVAGEALKFANSGGECQKAGWDRRPQLSAKSRKRLRYARSARPRYLTALSARFRFNLAAMFGGVDRRVSMTLPKRLYVVTRLRIPRGRARL